MGDKNPKSARKNAKQKKTETDASNKKKQAAIDAKSVPKLPKKK
jgi:hypothetical protein